MSNSPFNAAPIQERVPPSADNLAGVHIDSTYACVFGELEAVPLLRTGLALPEDQSLVPRTYAGQLTTTHANTQRDVSVRGDCRTKVQVPRFVVGSCHPRLQ